MANRVTLNPGVGGPDVLTDEVTSLNGASLSPLAEAQRSKVGFGGSGTYQDVAAGSPLPVTDAAMATLHSDLAAVLTELGQKLEPSDLNLLATAAKQDVTHTDLAAILAKLTADPATQTTLAAVLTELGQKLEPADLASLATGAKQDTLKTAVDAVTAKLTADPATQTTLAAVLAKLTTTAAAPLSTRLSDGTAYLNLATTADRLKVDVGGSLPAGTNALGSVSVSNQPSDPTTGTAQTAGNAKLDTLHTDVGAAGTSPPALAASASGLIGWLRKIVDTLTGVLSVTLTASADQVGTLTDGRKTVAVAGTAEAIRASLACKWVTVTALTSNTQQVNVGGSGVLATSGGSTGTPLFAGASTTIPVSNANLVFVDARVALEGVSFTVGS